MMTRSLISALFILVLALVGALFLYTWYRLAQKLHLHASPGPQTPGHYGLSAETQYVTTTDGERIAFWSFPVTHAKGVIILVHGYKQAEGGKGLMMNHVPYLAQAGYSTVVLDLRGHGESSGRKVSLGVKEWRDVEAVYDWVKAQSENQSKQVGLMGISMGAVTSLITAAETGKGDFVIASVPYASHARLFEFQVAKGGFPVFPFAYLMQLAAAIELGSSYQSLAPLATIDRITVPILLFSAQHDEEVNSDDAQLLYERAKAPKEFWSIDSRHDIHYFAPTEFEQRVVEFLNSL
jgi:alpha-beta hydrolase superfamily lysophospholipase